MCGEGHLDGRREHPSLGCGSLKIFKLLSFLSAGGNGYINDYPTGRIWRDAKLYEIGAGTSEIRRLIIGREFNRMFKQ
jgi:alkylation response protein AidB-like acyl-CoA dehydrogenase